MKLPADIAAAIVEDPDDIEARIVAGDWFQQQGDPQGELISLVRAKAPMHDERIRELQAQLAPLQRGWTVGWRDGFISRLTGTAAIDGFSPLADSYAAALELTNVGVRAAGITTLPKTLRSLSIRDDVIVRHAIANLNRIPWASLDRLEHLVLHLHHVAPPLTLPALEELVVYIDGVNMHELAQAHLPSLRRLRAVMVQPDLSIFTADRFPNLRRLAISSPVPITDRPPPLVDQLETYETLGLTPGERDTRRFPIVGPPSTEAAVLLDIGSSPGSAPGTITQLSTEAVFRVGRTPDAKLRLADMAPGAYVDLDWAGQGWWLRNNRANALLDSCAADYWELCDGDEVRLHHHAFRFFTGEDVEASIATARRRFGL